MFRKKATASVNYTFHSNLHFFQHSFLSRGKCFTVFATFSFLLLVGMGTKKKKFILNSLSTFTVNKFSLLSLWRSDLLTFVQFKMLFICIIETIFYSLSFLSYSCVLPWFHFTSSTSCSEFHVTYPAYMALPYPWLFLYFVIHTNWPHFYFLYIYY